MTSFTTSLPDDGAAVAAPTAQPAGRRRRAFARHLGEMLLAMVAGMVVLGAVAEGVLALASSSFDDLTAAMAAALMAFNMTVPMVWWMHRRGHAPARSVEMAAAMVVPTLAAIGLDLAGAIEPDAVMGVQHAVMIPAMVAVMLWRHHDYSH